MIPANRNQLANVTNRFQGSYKKVLCVCSAGLLRSPTMANVLHDKLDYNTRSCGALSSFALIPLSEALTEWADEIVFTDKEAFDSTTQEFRNIVDFNDTPVFVLDIPDNFNYNDSALKDIIFDQYMKAEALLNPYKE